MPRGKPKKKNTEIVLEPTTQNESVITVRMTDDLFFAIGEYADSTGEESIAAAARSLLALGLETAQVRTDIWDKQLRENYERATRKRMAVLIRAAYKAIIRAFDAEEIDYEDSSEE